MHDISKSEIGKWGEDVAMQWLREHGYFIVERNWRIGRYEIDIIAQHYDTLHIVEVKTRKAGSWQTPYDSIDQGKIRSLRRAGLSFRTICRSPLKLQFDLIAITVDDKGGYTIDHVENIM